MLHSVDVSQGVLLISSDFALARKPSLKTTFGGCVLMKVLVSNNKRCKGGSNHY